MTTTDDFKADAECGANKAPLAAVSAGAYELLSGGLGKQPIDSEDK